MGTEKQTGIDTARMKALAINLNNPELIDISLANIDQQSSIRVDKALAIIRANYFVGEGRVARIPSHITDDELAKLSEILDAVHNLAQSFFVYPEKYAKISLADVGNGQAIEPSAEAIDIVNEAGGELMNAAAEYRLIAKEEAENRKKANAAVVTPEKTSENVTKSENTEAFNSTVFQQELNTAIGGLDAKLLRFGTLMDLNKTTLNPEYPRKKSEYPTPDAKESLSRMKTDEKEVRETITSLQEYVDDNFPEQVTTLIVVQKRRYITKQIDWLQKLHTQLEAAKENAENQQDQRLVEEWRKDTREGLGRSEFQAATQAKNLASKGATSISDFENIRNSLTSAREALTQDSEKVIRDVLEALRKKGLTGGQNRIEKEEAEIRRIYIDSMSEAFVQNDKANVEFWKRKYLENTVFNIIRALELATPGNLFEYKKNYVDRAAEIVRLKADKANVLAKLPTYSAVRSDAEAFFDSKIAEMETKLNDLPSAQYEYWKNTEMSEANNPMKVVKEARDKGKTVASGGIEAEVVAAIAALDSADTLIDGSLRTREHELIDVKTHKAKIALWVTTQKQENEQIKVLLRKRKAEIAAEAIKTTVEAGTAGLQKAVDDIIRLKVPLKKDTTEDIELSALRVYEKALEDAETALNSLTPPVAIERADERYPRAKEKLDGLIERATIREYTLEQCIDIFMGTNTDVFPSAAEMKLITDLKEKQLISRFQGLYYQATSEITVYKKDPISGKDTKVIDVTATKEAQRRHRKLKTKIWAYRYQDENWGRQYIPAANPDHLYQGDAGLMNRRKLFREDFVEGVFGDPKYGRQSKKILQYAIDVVADEVPPKDEKGNEIVGKTSYDLGIAYDSLKSNADGWVVLKNHLHDVFMGLDAAGNSNTDQEKEEQFGILWDLYVSFDLASISLSKLQKGTKTRSHNQGTTADAQAFRTRPFGFMSHKRNRYTNLDEAKQHLLGLTGEWPQIKKIQDEVELDPVTLEEMTDPSTGKLRVRRVLKHVWAGNVHKLADGTHVRDTQSTQKLLRLQMNAYFPTEGIAGEIFSEEDLDEFIEQTKREIAADQTEDLRDEARKKGLDPKLIIEVDPNTIVVDREEARSKMWDQAVLPDHYDFLTKPTKEIGNQVLYETAQKGMDTILDMMIRSLPVLDEHAVFNANNGLYSEFINSGVGLAKLVKGNHIKMIVPMVRMFVARIGMRYSDDTLPGRKELKKKLVEQLGLSLQPKGGLDVDPSINGELRRFISELNAGGGTGAWSEIPPILCPWIGGMRQPERIEYMRAWYKDKTGKEAPKELDAKRINWGSDPDIQTYYDAIYERAALPDIIDRTANSKDTGDKKSGH